MLTNKNNETSAQLIERFSACVVSTIGFIVLMAFFYWSFRFTSVMNFKLKANETIIDSLPINILVFAIWVFSCVILLLILNKFIKDDITECKTIGIIMVVGFVLSATWVFIGHILPNEDSPVLIDVAMATAHGDYSVWKIDSYMSYNPHQAGLVFILEVLYRLSGFNDYFYKLFSIINAICIPLIIWFTYKICKKISNSRSVRILVPTLMLATIPLILYVPFIYGEIISIAMSLGIFYWTLENINLNTTPPRLC